MIKFSIIIPVYNVEKYISKCLNSIKEQTYENFEVIIVDDGSTDSSNSIIQKYLSDDRFTLYKKKNGGLSSARNYGVEKAGGDYIIFVDSDDYIDDKLLEELNNAIKNNYVDVIGYGVYIDDKRIITSKHNSFLPTTIDKCIYYLLDATFVETAWSYSYRADFYKESNFLFENGRYHEDFGLIPYILLKAKSLMSIPFYGYHYVIHNDSIMTTTDIEKNNKKIQDTLYLFDRLICKINDDNDINENIKSIMKNFLANVLICRSKVAPNLDDYIFELKNRNIDSYMMTDKISHKIKKYLFKLNPKLYIKFLVK